MRTCPGLRKQNHANPSRKRKSNAVGSAQKLRFVSRRQTDLHDRALRTRIAPACSGSHPSAPSGSASDGPRQPKPIPHLAARDHIVDRDTGEALMIEMPVLHSLDCTANVMT